MQKNMWILGFVCVLVLCLAAVSVSADISVTGPLKLGDDRQRASNPDADDEDKDAFVSGTLTIENTGTSTLTSLELDSVTPEGSFSEDGLKVTAIFAKTTLAPGEKTSVTVKARIPENLDAVEKAKDKLKETDFKVADLLFKDSDGSTAVSELRMQRENQLELDKVEVCVNDKCKSYRDGDDVKDVKPGDKIELRGVVENKYSDNSREDIDLEDVEVEFKIDDSDLSEDDNDQIDNLRADDKDEVVFSFDLDDDVKDGSYGLLLQAFGRDEQGALHGEHMVIDLRVDRKTHDITIRRADISPSQFVCGVNDYTARVTASLVNIGKRDENEVAVEVRNDELGLLERLENLVLDEDDSQTETLSLKISPKAKPGVYRFSVRSFFDNTAQSDEAEVVLTLPDCSDVEEDEEEEKTPEVVQVPVVQPVQPSTPQPPIIRPRASSGSSANFTESNTYIALLAGLTVVVLLALVFMVGRLMRR